MITGVLVEEELHDSNDLGFRPSRMAERASG